MDDTRLNKQIFLFDDSSDADIWCTDFHDICIKLDLKDDFMNLRKIDYSIFQDKMESYTKENWRLTVESKPKLRTYRLFKSEPYPEVYLKSFMNRFQRSTFAKFRCGIYQFKLKSVGFKAKKSKKDLPVM